VQQVVSQSTLGSELVCRHRQLTLRGTLRRLGAPRLGGVAVCRQLLPRSNVAGALPQRAGAARLPASRELRNHPTKVGSLDVSYAGRTSGADRTTGQSVDCFALSNVFEYAPEGLFERCKAELLRCARPGARICLRNLVAPRRLALDPRFIVDAALSHALQQADRAFIYSRFEAARIA